MSTVEQAEEFIENSRPAIEHLFAAIDEYNKVIEKAQITVEEIEDTERFLSDLFMYRDQWSPNANYYHAQYMRRMEELGKQKAEAQEDDSVRLEKAIFSIGTTVESMSSLAGAVLQIGKQALSMRHAGKPNLPAARTIGTQNIIEVIWEGRNHAMHWDEDSPRQRVRDMLNTLANDLGITIEEGKNNCLSVLGVLGWKKTDDVISDLKVLVQ